MPAPVSLRVQPPLWAFWLLAAAWFFASCPLATSAALDWIQGARTFNHQAHLRAQVSDLLSARAAPSSKQLATAPSVPGSPKRPIVVGNAAVKKVELTFASSDHRLLPRVVAMVYPATESRRPDCFRGEPAVEPPRAVLVS